jgi:Skp family chaperone for outer membrane proteins
VRLIYKAAILMAIAAGSVLAPSMASAQEATRVAIVDVAYIFKNHPGIKAQVTKVEGDLKRYDAELKGKRDQLKTAAEKLKTFDPGSPAYSAQEEQVASMESKLRLDMARKRKELADAEAKIYFDNYQQIAAGVKFLAEHNKINLVLRYNSEAMDKGKGDSVIRGVMKNIVFHDEALNMTPIVMQYLDRALKVATEPGAAATQR